MEENELEPLLTTAQAAELLSMTENAFRIHIHRYGRNIERVCVGKRKYYYPLSSVRKLMKKEKVH